MFDGSNIHDGAFSASAIDLSDGSADQFRFDTQDCCQADGETLAVAGSFDGPGDHSTSYAAAVDGSAVPVLDLATDVFAGTKAPASGLFTLGNDAALTPHAASLFASDGEGSVLSDGDDDGGATSISVKVTWDLPDHHALNVSLNPSDEVVSAQAFLPGAPLNLGAPGLASFAAPSFERGSALPAVAADHADGITIIDVDAFAKGGASKPGGGGGSGSGGVTQYFSGSADGTAGYDIWIDFKGTGWTASLQDAFIKAADYFTTVITDDIGGGGSYRGKVVDDLYVTAELATIDGTGGVLGQAGPSALWTSNDLTAAGRMQFDVADATSYLNQGLWDDIVTHEMMHVLGVGSLWNYGSHSLVSNFQYTGQNALEAYKAAGHSTATFVPVENDGGSGTAGSHWDELALNNELMTGYINNDGNPGTIDDNYLSEFSVMSLADLGYHVAYRDYQYDGVLIV